MGEAPPKEWSVDLVVGGRLGRLAGWAGASLQSLRESGRATCHAVTRVKLEQASKVNSWTPAQLRNVEDRLGHERCYAIDSTKIRRELGWSPRHTFEKGLERTVEWCRTPSAWLERCRSGAYRDYYRRHYEERAKRVGTKEPDPQPAESSTGQLPNKMKRKPS